MGLRRIFNEWREKVDGTLTGPSIETDNATVNGTTDTQALEAGNTQIKKDSETGNAQVTTYNGELPIDAESSWVPILDVTNSSSGVVTLMEAANNSNRGYILKAYYTGKDDKSVETLITGNYRGASLQWNSDVLEFQTAGINYGVSSPVMHVEAADDVFEVLA